MNEIKLITPPDRLYSQELTILLIYPSKKVKEEFSVLMANIEGGANVYLYELEDEHEPEWLLDTFMQSDIVILDIDNCSSDVRSLAAYFIAKDKTYWLTNSQDSLYNVISKNRIFSLDFLHQKLGGTFE